MSYNYATSCRTTMQPHVVRLYNLMSYNYATSCRTTMQPHVVRHDNLIKTGIKRRLPAIQLTPANRLTTNAVIAHSLKQHN